MSIPKTIHYCWFGNNPKSEKILRCMESWRKHLPEYEIIEWNEGNCDIDSSLFARYAYESKLWAFVADYFRFKVLYGHGGIYLDTDMLIHKPLDDFLKYDAFFPMECFENICAGIIGAAPKNALIKKLLDSYSDIERASSETVCSLITRVFLEEYGFEQTGLTQILKDNIAVFSPNILILNVDDGKNYCEHLYGSNISWLEGNGGLPEDATYKYTVLQKYFYNLFTRMSK